MPRALQVPILTLALSLGYVADAVATRIEVVSIRGGTPTIAAREPGTNEVVGAPRWAPDGNALFTTWTAARGIFLATTLVRVPLDGSTPQQLRRVGGEEQFLSPDASKVMEVHGYGRGGRVVVRDTSTARITARVMADRRARAFRSDGVEAAWSADGRRLAVAATERLGRVLRVVDAETGSVILRRRMRAFIGPQSFSPDGRRLALSFDGGYARPGVAIAELGSRQIRKLPGWGISTPEDFAWAPDGATLAIAQDEHIALVDPQTGWGAAYPVARDDEPTYDRGLVWSPDGASVAFVVDYYLGRQSTLSVIDVRPAPAPARVLVTRRRGYFSSLAYSPAGDRIAFTFGGV